MINTSIYPEDIEDCTINPRLSERRTAIKPTPLKPIDTFICGCCKQSHDNITCVICEKKICNLCVENNICNICLSSDCKQEKILKYYKKYKINRHKWCCW